MDPVAAPMPNLVRAVPSAADGATGEVWVAFMVAALTDGGESGVAREEAPVDATPPLDAVPVRQGDGTVPMVLPPALLIASPPPASSVQPAAPDRKSIDAAAQSVGVRSGPIAPPCLDRVPDGADARPVQDRPVPMPVKTDPSPATNTTMAVATPPVLATKRPAGDGERTASDVPVPAPGHSLSVPAAPGPAEPPRTHSPAPVLQVAQVAIQLASRDADEDRLSIALDPAELGRVEISIDRQGGAAQIRVIAERPETLAILQRDQRELDRLLGQSGIGEEGRSLSFSLSSGGSGDGGGSDAPRQQGGAPRQHAPPDTQPAPRTILGLIDLAI